MSGTLDYKVYVTKGELQTLMGFLDFGIAMLRLEDPSRMLAGGIFPAAAIVKSLNMTNGVYLDNPEVRQLFDLLVYEGIISDACKKKVFDYIDQKLAVNTVPTNSVGEQVIPYYDWKIKKTDIDSKFSVMSMCTATGPLFAVNYAAEDGEYWYYKVCDAHIPVGERF